MIQLGLFVVQTSVNQSKSDKGPLEWLPPDEGFHCQYVTRFRRLALKYDLSLSQHEQEAMASLYKEVCEK